MPRTPMVTGKIGELHVFGELLRKGVNPYVPLVDREGIDAVIRRRDGSYIELQIKTANTPQTPRWFGVQNLKPKHQLFIACVALATEPVETWIIPSQVFRAHSNYSPKSRYHDLNLDSTKRGSDVPRWKLLEEFREGWHLLTEEAEIAVEG